MKYKIRYIVKRLLLSSLKDYMRSYKIIRCKIQYLFCGLLKGFASIPPNFYIYVTNRCNYKCLMCDFGNQGDGYFKDNLGKEISLEDWKKLIDSVSFSKPAIFFAAPEPFLYKDILPLILYIKSRNLFCSVATNGSLLNRYLLELINAGIDTIELSCDGPEEIHDKVRGVPGAFANLISLMKEIQRIKGDSENPVITVTFTITHLNYLRIDELVSTLDSLGVKISLTVSHLSYMPMELVRIHNENHDLIKINSHTKSYAEICGKINTEELFKQLNLVRKRRTLNIKNLVIAPNLSYENLIKWYSMPEKVDSDSICFFPWISTNINFNGNVVLSPICGPVLGNITQQSFSEIWNNHKLREIRLRLRKDKRYGPCFGCCSARTF